MHVTTAVFAACALAEVGHAFKLPFGIQLPWANAHVNSQQLPLAISIEHEEPEVPSNRIAIIGAGAGGSSAAFWIGKAKERWGLDVEVDVFEASDYVGGSECSSGLCLSSREASGCTRKLAARQYVPATGVVVVILLISIVAAWLHTRWASSGIVSWSLVSSGPESNHISHN